MDVVEASDSVPSTVCLETNSSMATALAACSRMDVSDRLKRLAEIAICFTVGPKWDLDNDDPG